LLGFVAKFLFLPEKEDPDTMVRKEGKDAFEKRIVNAKTLSDFLFDNLKAESDITTNEGKAQLANKANALFQKMHNSLYKDLLIEELSSLVGLSHQHLESKLTSSTESRKPVVKEANSSRGQQVSTPKTRIAIALLLQNPELASKHKVPDTFKNAFIKGLPLLHSLQQTIESNTAISSAALLERFRDTEYEKALHKLAMLQTPETENADNILSVYTNIINRLASEDRDEYFRYKINNNEQLTAEELEEYLKTPEK